MNIAINGFGRIGKCVLRALVERGDDNLICAVINIGCGDAKMHAHLLKYDSTHGFFGDVKVIDEDTLEVAGREIRIIREKDLNKLDWREYGVLTVLDCSGAFVKKDLAVQHLAAGAENIVISAPCEGADATIVYGVNQAILNSSHKVISGGSCTTNCLAFMAKVLHEGLEIESGFMTTVHAYTNDQNLLDAKHKDLRRARAAAVSMIPSSTGAAKSLGLVLPELVGKLDGVAIRVPVSNVSLVDFKATVKKSASVKEINNLFKNAAASSGGVLQYVEEELVSVDFNHSSASCVFDATQTRVVGDGFVRIAAWYDNEWGFSNRMLDILALLARS